MGLNGLSAEERLIQIRVKIKRAKKHLKELEDSVTTFAESYQHVVGPAQTGGNVIWKLPIIHFDMLAVAGDILQNLRSALDHVVYHMALVADPNASDKVLSTVSFPVGKNLADYESLKKRKLEGIIKPTAIQFIDRYKPYKGGNDELWKLHDVNNIDKHRHLLAVSSDILCDGDGFEGYYWLKDKNPAFDKHDALLPSLTQITNYVEQLVEAFAPHLQ
jgi:hypothetical protein